MYPKSILNLAEYFFFQVFLFHSISFVFGFSFFLIHLTISSLYLSGKQIFSIVFISWTKLVKVFLVFDLFHCFHLLLKKKKFCRQFWEYIYPSFDRCCRRNNQDINGWKIDWRNSVLLRFYLCVYFSVTRSKTLKQPQAIKIFYKETITEHSETVASSKTFPFETRTFIKMIQNLITSHEPWEPDWIWLKDNELRD